MIDERKQKERQRWHERMKNPEFREAQRQRSIARRKKYMKDPEFRAKWNAYRRRRYAKLKERKNMLKLSTINQIVEAILEELGEKSNGRMIANEAVIYYKTAMICECKGIDKAMEYFTGTHNEDEYQEFRTSTMWGEK